MKVFNYRQEPGTYLLYVYHSPGFLATPLSSCRLGCPAFFQVHKRRSRITPRSRRCTTIIRVPNKIADHSGLTYHLQADTLHNTLYLLPGYYLHTSRSRATYPDNHQQYQTTIGSLNTARQSTTQLPSSRSDLSRSSLHDQLTLACCMLTSSKAKLRPMASNIPPPRERPETPNWQSSRRSSSHLVSSV
ncbi:hypothetical protein FA13DRAFT_1727250 [Coprinellus micaceus]|uniref:Uncharacterized protein n=1 Tax=Coprinellus micaceus TaxID=71717 RepID=A0A4Y7TRR5_COPMI|nr:hypothetical protein FA13DRAFT_1727250 [Coprinellus micaceus]